MAQAAHQFLMVQEAHLGSPSRRSAPDLKSRPTATAGVVRGGKGEAYTHGLREEGSLVPTRTDGPTAIYCNEGSPAPRSPPLTGVWEQFFISKRKYLAVGSAALPSPTLGAGSAASALAGAAEHKGPLSRALFSRPKNNHITAQIPRGPARRLRRSRSWGPPCWSRRRCQPRSTPHPWPSVLAPLRRLWPCPKPRAPEALHQ